MVEKRGRKGKKSRERGLSLSSPSLIFIRLDFLFFFPLFFFVFIRGNRRDQEVQPRTTHSDVGVKSQPRKRERERERLPHLKTIQGGRKREESKTFTFLRLPVRHERKKNGKEQERNSGKTPQKLHYRNPHTILFLQLFLFFFFFFQPFKKSTILSRNWFFSYRNISLSIHFKVALNDS